MPFGAINFEILLDRLAFVCNGCKATKNFYFYFSCRFVFFNLNELHSGKGEVTHLISRAYFHLMPFLFFGKIPPSTLSSRQ